MRRASIVVLCLTAACGTRTGLEGIGLDSVADAGVDARVTSPDAGIDASVGCTSGDIVLTRADPAVMFVLDRSGSMGTAFGTGGSRWRVLTNALASTLPSVDASMQIGALLFPNGGTRGRTLTCTVPTVADLAPAIGHVSPLLSLLRGTTPGGGTPTAVAIDVGARLLESTRAATTARAVILATDGAPNCNASLSPSTCTCVASTSCGQQPEVCLDDARTVATIADYEKRGLPTYVIGLQDSNDAQLSAVLDAMAEAGGRPQTGGAHRYYSASSEAELAAALTLIRDQVGFCTFLTTSVPDDRGTITIDVDGTPIPFDPSGQDGWKWSNESNGEIVITGAACAKIAAMTGASPTAHVTCSDGGAK